MVDVDTKGQKKMPRINLFVESKLEQGKEEEGQSRT